MTADDGLDGFRNSVDEWVESGRIHPATGARIRDRIEWMAARVRELEAAVEAERERCAKVAESWSSDVHPMGPAATAGYRAATVDIVAAIRARAADAGRGEGGR